MIYFLYKLKTAINDNPLIESINGIVLEGIEYQNFNNWYRATSTDLNLLDDILIVDYTTCVVSKDVYDGVALSNTDSTTLASEEVELKNSAIIWRDLFLPRH